MKIIDHIKDKISGRVPRGTKRSHLWEKTKKQYLEINPVCNFCGTFKKLEVHHIKSFHEFPEDELKFSNLMTVCRDCHFIFCHLKNWKRNNQTAIEDAQYWYTKFHGLKP